MRYAALLVSSVLAILMGVGLVRMVATGEGLNIGGLFAMLPYSLVPVAFMFKHVPWLRIAAIVANGLAIALSVVLVIGAVEDGKPVLITLGVAIVIVGLSVLNILALRQLKAEQAAGQTEPRPAT